MIDEILDEDGYPTDEFLEVLRSWPHQKGFDELLQEAMKAHIYPSYWQREEDDGKAVWNISTGGWSGNESIIYALEDNDVFWFSCWVQSRRGGHYIFECRLKS